MDPARLALAAEGVEATPFEIPGATGGRFLIQIPNGDAARGVVTTIVYPPPGGRIPAHFHRAGPEMHYLLEGDLVEADGPLGPGAFLTHAAGAVHGPHRSRVRAKVLTVQRWRSQDRGFDLHPADDEGPAKGPPPGGTAAALPPDPTAPNLDNRGAEASTS